MLDKVGAMALIIIFIGICILILLLYLISFNWPVFFVQQRMGMKQRPFWIIKFRTLRTTDGTNQDRKFALGNLLRWLSLDELPQLWNILKGEMSFIGPRPLPLAYASLFSEEQKKRFKVKPGLTGWAQVNGRHSISWEKKFVLDNYYVDHVSLKLDALILFRTVILLLSFKKDKSLDEPKFTGSK